MIIRNGQALGSLNAAKLAEGAPSVPPPAQPLPELVIGDVTVERIEAAAAELKALYVVEKPKASAPKADWVAYAKSRGVEDAEELTKAELIELLGSE